MDYLEKIDLIRHRFNVSYKKAKDVLSETNEDVVEALIKLEESGAETHRNQDKNNSGNDTQFSDTDENMYKVKGQELIKKIKKIIKDGNVSKISVTNKKNETLLEIPVTAGVISLVLFPYIGILAGLGAMYKEYTLKIEKEENTEAQKNQGNSNNINQENNQENKENEYYPFE